jgi:hypothetical protein
MSTQDRTGQRRTKVLGPQYRPPLPLPTTPPPGRSDVVFAMSRLTNGGRLTNQTITTSLGWNPGLRVTFTVSGGLIVVAADPAGPRKLDVRGCLFVPVTVLRSCGLHGDETVLMAALPQQQRLILHPPGVLARLTDAAHTMALRGGR